MGMHFVLHSLILQNVQNNAARVILKKRKMDSATEDMESLHWRLIQWRCKYKIAALAHKLSNPHMIVLSHDVRHWVILDIVLSDWLAVCRVEI